MMRRYLFLFIMLLSACGQKKERIREDDFVVLNFTEKTPGGRLISGSGVYDERPAQLFRERSYFKGDFFEHLGTLREGDSAGFKISVDSLIRKQGRISLKNIGAAYLVYQVKIIKVVDRGDKNDSLFNAAIEQERLQQDENAKNAEPGKILRYIRQQGQSLHRTASGLYYTIAIQGTGKMPAKADTVVIGYTARTLTGKVVATTDASVARTAAIYQPNFHYGLFKLAMNVPAGEGSYGLMEAMRLFPEGTNAHLLLPSKLAYGGNAFRMLGPYTPLVCDLEIKAVIRMH